jgi:hypothetical protein
LFHSARNSHLGVPSYLIGAFIIASMISTGVSAQDLSLNQTEANAVQKFDEKKTVSISANQVTVDRLIGDNMSIGVTITPPTNYGGTGRSLPAGFYNSYIFHLDGVGTSGSITRTGTLTFDEEIVALIYSNSGSATLLNTSDPIFGLATAFDTNESRRLETNDRLTLVDLFTLDYSFRAGNNFTDNLRVITKPLEANVTSTKTVSIHSSMSVDCEVIPGTPEPGVVAAIPGTCMEYVIILVNGGAGNATGLSVEDVIGPDMIFQSAVFSGFITSDPAYSENSPAIGTSCGGLACIVSVENAGLDASDTATIVVRSLIK